MWRLTLAFSPHRSQRGDRGFESPLVHQILKGLPGVAQKTSIHNPIHKLAHRICTDSERHQIFPLCRACFVAVVLRVEIERRLDRFCCDARFFARSWVRSSPCSPASCLGCDASCEARTAGHPLCISRLSLLPVGDDQQRR